jgi:hypothetical protein
MAQAVSSQLLKPKARDRSQVSASGLFGGKSDTETGLSPSIHITYIHYRRHIILASVIVFK